MFRRNWSGLTDGLHRLLGSEFQTVGPAEAKERQPKVLQRTRGGSQVPATGNVGHWNAVVDEVRRCLIPETPVDGHGKLVLHSLRDVQPVQFIVK